MRESAKGTKTKTNEYLLLLFVHTDLFLCPLFRTLRYSVVWIQGSTQHTTPMAFERSNISQSGSAAAIHVHVFQVGRVSSNKNVNVKMSNTHRHRRQHNKKKDTKIKFKRIKKKQKLIRIKTIEKEKTQKRH